MITVTPEQFEALVQQAVERIPARFAEYLDNVAFLVADEPTREQLAANGQFHNETEVLLGLYEGIPLPERGDGYNLVLPDTITVFRRAHQQVAQDLADLERDVHETVWHEVAHYFGLDHDQIDKLHL